MNTKKSKWSGRLFPTLALVLSVSFLLTLPPISIGATDLANDVQQGAQVVTTFAQGSTDVDVPLGGAGEWARASVEIASAPADAVVSAVRVKYHVVYPEAAKLEVQLLASGAEGAYALGDGGSAEGGVLAQSTGEMAAFRGAPVNGTWSLAVQGGGAEGYIDDFGVIVYYEMEMPVLQVEGGGEPGVPTFLRRPEGIAPASTSPDSDEGAGEEPPVAPQAVPPGATIIEQQSFASFPTTRWSIYGDPTWDDAGCDACGGDRAAWPADGGANRVDPCAGNNYLNNQQSWMIYGPFDLSRANNAGTDFTMWFDTELNWDSVFFGVSGDGVNFSGVQWTGYRSCTPYAFTYSGLLGDPSVWVAWVFESDGSVTDRGAWVDDAVIWKVEDCATVRISPSAVTANASSPFSFDVAIENANNLGAFQFDVTYPTGLAGNDPAHPACATLGPFLGSTGRSVTPVGPTCGSGIVTYGAYSVGSGAGPTGNGVLATIHLKAGSSTGNGTLRLQNVRLTDPAGTVQCVQTQTGTITVIPPCNSDCPEDQNGDRVIDIVDIQLVASKFGRHCPTR